MRRLIISLAAQRRLAAGMEFLCSHAGQEILVLSSTRTAADELVRQCSVSNGVFGAHRFTPAQLAFMLAAERLAQDGKSFVTGVAMDAMAARAVQASRASGTLSWFDAVATTPGFFRALASTIQELRLNGITPDRIRPAGSSGPDLASLLEHFDRYLRDSEAADLAGAYEIAITVISATDFRFKACPLLLLDVVPVSYLEQQFLQALAEAAPSILATAHARDAATIAILEDALDVQAEADDVHGDRALDRLRSYAFETSASSGDLDSSVCFLSATDEARECAEVVRSILSFAKSGTPFDQMAVVLRNPDVYQASLEDALRRANIPAYFSLGSRRPNPAGRALLALLACAAEGLSASRFSEYLSLGQAPKVDVAGKPDPRPPQWIPVQGELFPDPPPPVEAPEVMIEGEDSPVISGSLRAPYQWERLLVDAAVIGGRDRWVRRLDGLANEFKKQIAEALSEDESVANLQRQLDRLGYLRSFALPIIEFLDRLPQRATWNEWLDVLDQLAVLAIRQPEFVLAVLTEIRPMGDVGPIALDEVREVLNHRLTFLRTETSERRYGKVYVTTPSELGGLSFDVVFLPGLAEDNFPKKAFEDPLLLDDARESISPVLARQSARIRNERLLLHISAGAARSMLWVSFPRMDVGQGRSRNPSFYALDILRAITGKTPSLRELQRRSVSHTQSQIGWPAPRDPDTAIDDAEYDLAVISGLVHTPRPEAAGRARYLLSVNANLARSLRARSGRWRKTWTEGDGIIPPDAAVQAVLAGERPTTRPYSATALQNFAACPYRFLLYSIHRIRPRTETVAIERMDALTRGSLFHNTQYRLLSELRARGLLPITADNFGVVIPIVDRVFDETAESYREELAPAIPRIWESQIEDIRWDLRGWIREMSAPANAEWTPRWFELSFGLGAARDRDPESRADPVELTNGVLVRGAIDMIEEHNDAIRITDHKTGRAPSRHPGVTGEGEVLQPILYAQAAEALLGKRAESARLFYCTERGGYQSFEIPINEYSRQSLTRVIQLIERSIVDGFLPAAPRDGACAYCDYRPICGPYEESRVRRKPQDRLAVLTELRERS